MRSRSALCALVITALVGTTLVATAASAPAARTSGQKAPSGSVEFALEAETTGGFCLPQAQLAASGHQVRVAIYDSLTTINSKGDYVPYLAKSVEPNATFDEWTVALREGVKFHDGTPVDAEAIKFNLDTIRGVNPALPTRLLTFVYSNIATVTVTDPLTVVVTTKTPWPAFPAYLVDARHGGAGTAQRPGDVRDEHDRQRTVQARGVAAERVAHGRGEHRLLAQGLPQGRRDRLPAGARRAVEGQRPQERRVRPAHHVELAADRRPPAAGRGRRDQGHRHRQGRRDRVPAAQLGQGAVRRPCRA